MHSLKTKLNQEASSHTLLQDLVAPAPNETLRHVVDKEAMPNAQPPVGNEALHPKGLPGEWRQKTSSWMTTLWSQTEAARTEQRTCACRYEGATCSDMVSNRPLAGGGAGVLGTPVPHALPTPALWILATDGDAGTAARVHANSARNWP